MTYINFTIIYLLSILSFTFPYPNSSNISKIELSGKIYCHYSLSSQNKTLDGCDVYCEPNEILSAMEGCSCPPNRKYTQCGYSFCTGIWDDHKNIFCVDSRQSRIVDCTEELKGANLSPPHCLCLNGGTLVSNRACLCASIYEGQFCENRKSISFKLDKEDRSGMVDSNQTRNGQWSISTRLLAAFALKLVLIAFVLKLYSRYRQGRAMATLSTPPRWVVSSRHGEHGRRMARFTGHIRSRTVDGRRANDPDYPSLRRAFSTQSSPAENRRTTQAPAYEKVVDETPPPTYDQAVSNMRAPQQHPFATATKDSGQ